MLRNVELWLVTDVSGLSVGPTVEGPAIKERCIISQESEDLIYTMAEAWNSSQFFCWQINGRNQQTCDQPKKSKYV